MEYYHRCFSCYYIFLLTFWRAGVLWTAKMMIIIFLSSMYRNEVHNASKMSPVSPLSSWLTILCCSLIYVNKVTKAAELPAASFFLYIVSPALAECINTPTWYTETQCMSQQFAWRQHADIQYTWPFISCMCMDFINIKYRNALKSNQRGVFYEQCHFEFQKTLDGVQWVIIKSIYSSCMHKHTE